MRPRSGAQHTRRSPIACARGRSTSSPASRSSSARARRCAVAIEEDRVSSSIFFGPPGTGKTTLARIIAASTAVGVRGALGGLVGQGRRAGGDRPRARAAGRAGPAHRALHRRDPPLQQGAAGRAAAGRRVGPRDADRRDDREPVPLDHRRARLALPAVRVRGPLAGRPAGGARARRGRPRRAAPPGPDVLAAIAATAARRRAPRALDARARARARDLARRAGRSEQDVEAGRAAPSRALRPRRRPSLRHDLGVHQERARERPRRRALLPRGHARGRRGPASTSRAGSRSSRARTSATPTRARSSSPSPARASWSWSACRSAATRSPRRRPTWRWRRSRTRRRRRSAPRRTPFAPTPRRDRPRRCATPATAVPASSAAAWATSTRTTRRGRSWPTTTCRPSSAARASTSPSEHGLEAKLAERVRELRRLRAARRRAALR